MRSSLDAHIFLLQLAVSTLLMTHITKIIFP